MSKNIFKNDEELNTALDEISDAYSKPPTIVSIFLRAYGLSYCHLLA